MIAVKFSEDDKYGCPNCGCDRWVRDSSYCGNQVGGTCKSCLKKLGKILKHV